MSKLGKEIIQGLTEAIAYKRLEMIKYIDDDTLRKICAAYSAGSLLILPCKMMDTVYMVLPANLRCTKYRVVPYKVTDVKCLDSFEDWRIVVEEDHGWEIEVKPSDFGKIAFLDEKEAKLNAQARTVVHDAKEDDTTT